MRFKITSVFGFLLKPLVAGQRVGVWSPRACRKKQVIKRSHALKCGNRLRVGVHAQNARFAGSALEIWSHDSHFLCLNMELTFMLTLEVAELRGAPPSAQQVQNAPVMLRELQTASVQTGSDCNFLCVLRRSCYIAWQPHSSTSCLKALCLVITPSKHQKPASPLHPRF